MAKALRTQWYEETAKTLRISGKSRRTQELRPRSVRMLIEYSGREPDEISEEELRDYLLYRKNDCGWAPDTMKICHCGIRFFCEHVIRRDWHIFNILKSERERRLPCVLSRKEVYAVLSHVRTFHNYSYFATGYACGFRRPCTSKPEILTKTVCSFTFTGAKGLSTAVCLLFCRNCFCSGTDRTSASFQREISGIRNLFPVTFHTSGTASYR